MADKDKARGRWWIVSILLVRGSVILWVCTWLAFMYLSAVRVRPQPQLGRVFGWANHGSWVYLTRHEVLALKAIFVVAPVLFACGAIIGWKCDPWERRWILDPQTRRWKLVPWEPRRR